MFSLYERGISIALYAHSSTRLLALLSALLLLRDSLAAHCRGLQCRCRHIGLSSIFSIMRHILCEWLCLGLGGNILRSNK